MKKLLRWSDVLRRTYGERVQKVALDTGAGCPHRHGLAQGGCIFCDENGGGSGAFIKGIPLEEQVKKGVEGALRHYRAKSVILYFQSYSATFQPLEEFQQNLETAVKTAEALGATVQGVSVSTRPDLLPQKTVAFLLRLAERYETWVELGVQTVDPSGLKWLRRGHDLADVDEALRRLYDTPLKICAHLIAGIPDEAEDQLTQSALWLAERGVHALKFHPLYVTPHTELERLYREGTFIPLTEEQYLTRLLNALIALPDGMIIQRLMAGVRPAQLVAPSWILNKEQLERKITQLFNEHVQLQESC
ncbi:MAG: TIGR01212 family radical SAM protein [Pyramidobacter sp.]|jgi:radical SAM protein (TIGR01212 family)